MYQTSRSDLKTSQCDNLKQREYQIRFIRYTMEYNLKAYLIDIVDVDCINLVKISWLDSLWWNLPTQI
jgi:hypothetical protein